MYKSLKESLDKQNVTLVAVSKTKPESDILNLYNQGQRIFGENKVQELCSKYESLPKDIEWHLIGHLQKNKVKYIAPFVNCIQSVDSIALAQKIDLEASKNKRVIDVLLQIKIAKEESKFGFSFEEILQNIETLNSLKNIKIIGVMGMGTFTSDEEITINEFKNLIEYNAELGKQIDNSNNGFKVISMGMSGDYKLAIAHGSNMVRIGSLLFGNR